VPALPEEKQLALVFRLTVPNSAPENVHTAGECSTGHGPTGPKGFAVRGQICWAD
jgi:hypothetical protein